MGTDRTLRLRPERRLFDAARPESDCKLFNTSAGSCGVTLYGGFLAAPLEDYIHE